MRNAYLLIICLFGFLSTRSQSASVLAGFAADANNAGNAFYFIPVQLQWTPEDAGPLALTLTYDAGLNSAIITDGYTLNPDLPRHIAIRGKAKTNLITLGFSLLANLYKSSDGNQLQISLMPLGYAINNLKISRERFDHNNFTLMDPAVNQKRAGFVSGLELRYNFDADKIITLGVQTPIYRKHEVGSHYQYVAPARLMFGYRFNSKKVK